MLKYSLGKTILDALEKLEEPTRLILRLDVKYTANRLYSSESLISVR